MAVHPPAMGGKTAWGVSEVVSRPTDDPHDIVKMRQLQADFSKRENDRLERLHEMERDAGGILEARKARRLEFQPAATNDSDFRKRQDDILRKMQEARESKRKEKKERKKKDNADKPKEKKEKKRKERSESSSSSDSDSGSSSSSSSSSGSGSARGGKGKAEAAQEAADAAPAAPQDAEARRRAEEAKAREKELRRKAKEQAAAWAAEARRREAEQEAKRQQEAKRRAEEQEQKRQQEAKRKAEEQEAKKRAEEEQKQKAASSEAKKNLFKIDKRPTGDGGSGRRETVAGGFYKGQRVLAAQDITVRGTLVVKAGAAGSVVGRSESDPTGRIAVRFLQREDTGLGNLNVVPREIKKG